MLVQRAIDTALQLVTYDLLETAYDKAYETSGGILSTAVRVCACRYQWVSAKQLDYNKYYIKMDLL